MVHWCCMQSVSEDKNRNSLHASEREREGYIIQLNRVSLLSFEIETNETFFLLLSFNLNLCLNPRVTVTAGESRRESGAGEDTKSPLQFLA